MKMEKAIRLTAELQEKVDHIYNKERILVPHDQSMETSLG